MTDKKHHKRSPRRPTSKAKPTLKNFHEFIAHGVDLHVMNFKKRAHRVGDIKPAARKV